MMSVSALPSGHGRSCGARAALSALAVGAALVSSGCATNTPSATTATTSAAQDPGTSSAAPGPSTILVWWQSGASDKYTAIGHDSDSVATAAGAQDVAGLVAACKSLQSDTEAAQAYTPAPDQSVQQPLSEALAMYARAATDCISGGERIDPSLITQGANEMAQGTAKVNEAVAAIKAAGGN
jgi:hypothetical protein